MKKHKNAHRMGNLKKIGIFFIAGYFLTVFTTIAASAENRKIMKTDVLISTDFSSGGGTASPIQSEPLTLHVTPHNEGQVGWSQVWWYFRLDGLTPGKDVILQIDQNPPKSAGISPQIFFSYDQNVWGLTNTGNLAEIGGKSFFVYRHKVRGNKVWFAYDLPYPPEQIETQLVPELNQHPDVTVFELCKTQKNRSVKAFRVNAEKTGRDKKYGIWLQARAHAFESGGSWVVHELLQWILSGDPDAVKLRECSLITIIPIIDVDGVAEGRTGKNQLPYDHNRGWEVEPAYWPEIREIKSMLSELAEQNMLDVFVDFHGPGQLSHPYFIVPFSNDLPYEKQRRNRHAFFEVLKAKALTDEEKQTQSMTRFHFSPRLFDSTDVSSSSKWVTRKTNEHTVALTLEVNMNTPLSTRAGYRAEAIAFGKALSAYFFNGFHRR